MGLTDLALMEALGTSNGAPTWRANDGDASTMVIYGYYI